VTVPKKHFQSNNHNNNKKTKTKKQIIRIPSARCPFTKINRLV